MKKINLIVMLSLSVFAANGVADSASEDFDSLCALAYEANEMGLPAPKNLQYFNTNINIRIKSEDIIEAYMSLSYLDPENRYTVFKDAAEATLNKSWACDALESLINDSYRAKADIQP